jgi:hypothetical protein
LQYLGQLIRPSIASAIVWRQGFRGVTSVSRAKAVTLVDSWRHASLILQAVLLQRTVIDGLPFFLLVAAMGPAIDERANPRFEIAGQAAVLKRGPGSSSYDAIAKSCLESLHNAAVAVGPALRFPATARLNL